MARNSEGAVIEAISKCQEGCRDPETVEAMGVNEALGWIKHLLKQIISQPFSRSGVRRLCCHTLVVW